VAHHHGSGFIIVLSFQTKAKKIKSIQKAPAITGLLLCPTDQALARGAYLIWSTFTLPLYTKSLPIDSLFICFYSHFYSSL
jgi:hypothetical protein